MEDAASPTETEPAPHVSPADPETPETPSHRKKRILFAVVAVAVVLTLALLARRAGIDTEYLKAFLARLGPMAGPVFILVFAIGVFLHLPGVIFIVTARVVFGPVMGLLLAYVGALSAISLSFGLARTILPRNGSGEVAFRPKWRPLARAFEKLEAQPIRTIALLRAVFWLSAPFNYALAASRVRVRDYLLGSAIGLLLPIPLIVFATGLF